MAGSIGRIVFPLATSIMSEQAAFLSAVSDSPSVSLIRLLLIEAPLYTQVGLTLLTIIFALGYYAYVAHQKRAADLT